MLKFKKSEEIKKQSDTYIQKWDNVNDNKSSRMVRTQKAIDKQIGKISNKVLTSSMTNKEKRKHFALINK